MIAIKIGGMGWVSAVTRHGKPWVYERNRKFAIALSEWQVKRVISYCETMGWQHEKHEHSDDWHSRLTATERFIWESTKKEVWEK